MHSLIYITSRENAMNNKKPARYEGVEFDLYIARYYKNKVDYCRKRKLNWALTISDVRRMFNRKLCAYSGIQLSHQGARGNAGDQNFTDATLERIDNNIGYVKGNCVVVCYGFNNLKAQFENPTHAASFKDLYRFADTLRKMKVK